MFGRRRHVAAVAVAQIPQLSEAQIHSVVSARLAEFLGPEGEWVVARRTDDDIDTIFQETLTETIATDLTRAITHAKETLITGQPAESGQHVAQDRAPAVPTSDEPAAEPEALGWVPAPITIWTDLRKPVTGEIPTHRREHQLVA